MMLLVSSEGVLRNFFVFMKFFWKRMKSKVCWFSVCIIYLPRQRTGTKVCVINAFWVPRQRTGTKIVLHGVLFGSEPKNMWYQLNSKILSNVRFVCINFISFQSQHITMTFWNIFLVANESNFRFQFIFRKWSSSLK